MLKKDFSLFLIIVLLFLLSPRVFSADLNIGATVPAICGNGVVEGDEECDDGNTIDGDGCSSVCTNEGGGLPPADDGGDNDGGEDGGDDGNGGEGAGDNDGGEDGGDDGGENGADDGGGEDNDNGGGVGADEGGDNGNGGVGGNNNEDNGDNNQVGGGEGNVINNVEEDFVVEENIEGTDLEESEFINKANYFLSDFSFAVANGFLPVDFVSDSVVSLVNDRVKISFLNKNKTEKKIFLFFNNKKYQFREKGRIYYLFVNLSQIGRQQAKIQIIDQGQVNNINFSFNVLGYGRVLTSDKGDLQGTKLTLLTENNEVWPAQIYGQKNPLILSSQGYFGFVVPNGKYKIKIEKAGYNNFETINFYVNNHVINYQYRLIKKVENLDKLLEEADTATEKVGVIAEYVGAKLNEQALKTAETIRQVNTSLKNITDKKEVQEVNKKVIAPTVVATTVVATAPSLLNVILPLFRFLFLQPLLLVGRKRRYKWGMVYNSLNKLPVDLAVVRLIDAQTKRVVQSKVTDKNGRFGFIVKPGKYILKVVKKGYIFPSNVLRKIKSDGKLLDIYHGEIIEVVSNSAVTPNIPLDIEGESKTPWRIWRHKIFVGIQHSISILGIVLTAFSFYVSPSLYIGSFLIIHIIIYTLFVVYVKPKKPKTWGIVYDRQTKKPIKKVIIKLFSNQYNRLITSQITDNNGRYAFLVGPSQYKIVLEKKGYKPVEKVINVEATEKAVISEDLFLEKAFS